jgi:hypothetical protein
MLRQRCDARGFKRLAIGIIARQKVAPAFEAIEMVAGGRTDLGYIAILTMRD